MDVFGCGVYAEKQLDLMEGRGALSLTLSVQREKEKGKATKPSEKMSSQPEGRPTTIP